MKLLITTIALTFTSLASAGTTPALKRLSCLASNGTTFETIGRRAAGLAIETELGLFTREFTAALVVDQETEKTTVELTDETGRVSYLLDLTVDLTMHKQQTRVGAVIRTGDGYVAPAVVATTLCDLTLRK
jgi:hypothetical protein